MEPQPSGPPFVIHDFIHHPFLLGVHPEVVVVSGVPIREHLLVIWVIWPKQSAVEYVMYASLPQYIGQFKCV